MGVQGATVGRKRVNGEDIVAFLLLPLLRAEGHKLWHLVAFGQRGSLWCLGLSKVDVFVDISVWSTEQALSGGAHLIIIALTDPPDPSGLGRVCY